MTELCLKGQITKVTRLIIPGTAGVVTLDHPYGGKKYAAINDDTRGRVALMNKSRHGRLE